ncbi:GMC family oxidoreductase [Hymenobacter sp. BT559]|uniref:GMC family oxidoreductase n=1 Tax=Hymenobacter sp. BT559 TaxID=2795729 RepID=UPI0018EDF3FE|nr:GMC family oxidoreductase [Hymenobacter sp. BT559]MBJ6146285.1 GMC family oxidoreductase [Hymenobacter sp. BT559]
MEPLNELAFDVVVVGTGVCGALISHKLSQRGVRVLMLEAGPDQRANRIQMAGAYVASANRNLSAPYFDGIVPPDILGPDSSKGYYDQSSVRSEQLQSTFQRTVGGSTWHFLGNMPRFVPSDFELYSRYHKGVDWPISYEVLEPYYTIAEKEIGVAGDHDAWNDYLGAFRSKPYPMHAIWPAYGDKFFDSISGRSYQDESDGSARVVQVLRTPQARNSTIYDGRPACAGNSTCTPICPIQAKYDASVHIKKATATGAHLISSALVKKLEVDPKTGVITHLSVLRYGATAESREESLDISNKTVIIAANAIETPRLLLMSGISKGGVGLHLMDHLQGYALAEASEPIYPFRGPITTSGIDVFRDGKFRSESAAFRISIGNDGWGREGSPAKETWKLLLEDKFGPGLRAAVRDRLTRMHRISFSTEMLPEATNRVELSAKVDAFGLPRPKITFSFPDYNKRAFLHAGRVAEWLYKQTGWTQRPLDKLEPSGAGHIIGTTRMGTASSNSFADSFGAAHEHPNLYVAGPCLFPTAGTANPTLTAVALALRTADRLLQLLVP